VSLLYRLKKLFQQGKNTTLWAMPKGIARGSVLMFNWLAYYSILNVNAQEKNNKLYPLAVYLSIEC